VAQDPNEEHDLAATLPPETPAGLIEEFRRACALKTALAPSDAAEQLDPAVREKLKALGYVE